MGYETIRRIGRGGTGVVDLGRAPDGREVALKRLSLHGTPEELEKARIRVKREAEVLRRLDHPALVALLDVVDDGDDIVLVMDYLPGGNLAQRVGERGPLAPGEVDALADRLLDGLAAAHRQGVVHRDIKPANVLFDDEGRASLADFGAAVHRDATPGLTASEMVVGTPGFMSPEQARGDDATAASDVFCLGATLAYAATGAGPFGTGVPRVLMLRAAAGRTEKLPRTLPPDLRRRLDAMLDKDPAKRPTAAAARGGPAGTHLRTAARVVPRGRGRWVAVGLAALLAVGLVVAGLVAALGGDDDPRAAPTTTTRPAPTTEPCRDLPFRPCGSPVAPGTDGRRCLTGRADYDEDADNGCEAIADDLDDRTVLDGPTTANLVPEDDVDLYLVVVDDGFQILGGGTVRVTLTAPRGVSQRLTLLDPDSGDELGTVVSSDGTPASIDRGDPSYLGDDSTTLLARVEPFGSDVTDARYTIEATGSW